MYRCKKHETILVIERRGNRVHRTITTRPDPKKLTTHCTLLMMASPRSIEEGQLWSNPATGRDAYSNCSIEEV